MQTAFFYTVTLRLTKAQKRRNVLSENSVDSRGGTRAGKDVPPYAVVHLYYEPRSNRLSHSAKNGGTRDSGRHDGGL